MSDVSASREFYESLCSKVGIDPIATLVEQMKALDETKSLWRVLDVKDQKLDLKHCHALAQLILRYKELEHIILDNCEAGDDGFIEIANAAMQQNNLTRVDAALNKLTTKSANTIASLIAKEDSTLICLDLRGNSLYGRGGVLLGKALASPNCRLQILRIEDTELDERGLSSICEGLKSNPYILNLHLGANMIDVRGSRILSDSLRSNTVLTNLDLRFNKLRDDGASQIANYLRVTQSLQGLILWKNGIGKEGMSAIARAMAVNKSLKVFDVGQNAIGVDGIVALKEALLVNNTLTSIGLASTKMAGEGCIALAEALETNKSLMRLDLRRNAVGVAGLMALSLSMKMNTKITYIALDDASQGDEVELNLKADIESRCERNALDSGPKTTKVMSSHEKKPNVATTNEVHGDSSTVQSITEPATEPVTEPATEPVTEPVTEPITQSITEPITQSLTEPVTQSIIEPVTEPVAQPINQPGENTSKAAIDYDPFEDIFSSTATETHEQHTTQSTLPASFSNPAPKTAQQPPSSSSSSTAITKVLDEFDELLGL